MFTGSFSENKLIWTVLAPLSYFISHLKWYTYIIYSLSSRSKPVWLSFFPVEHKRRCSEKRQKKKKCIVQFCFFIHVYNIRLSKCGQMFHFWVNYLLLLLFIWTFSICWEIGWLTDYDYKKISIVKDNHLKDLHPTEWYKPDSMLLTFSSLCQHGGDFSWIYWTLNASALKAYMFYTFSPVTFSADP